MQKLVVLGAGESGVGAALLAKQQGWDVFVSDSGKIAERYQQELDDAGIDWEEGAHSLDVIFAANEVVKSPGIPDTIPMIQQLHAREIPVISEIEFAGRYTEAKTICITGSNGKTTTTMLIHHLLKQAGVKVEMAGNVGTSLARQIAEGKRPEWFVLELSSFQLDGMYQFKADIAILLNITPDHLDRYDYSMQKYIDSKFRIVQNQTEKDVFVYCQDDEIIARELQNRLLKSELLPFTQKGILKQGAYSTFDELIINYNDETMRIISQELSLQGRHNLYNSMAAGIVAKVLKIRKKLIRESLSSFKGAAHRLERVAAVRGIEFINDSKATNINSTWYALECMNNPVIWIAGGVDKGNDYNELMELVEKKVKVLICLGTDNGKLLDAFKGKVPVIKETQSMDEAVKLAYRSASKNDVVLLSPACASFDLFDNYIQRGDLFKESVRNL
ncbi:UDP-N-acetylmuramoyl-L-alanine--D-glutamate ligase [Carboxylicivirga mesophila]|uniref:UDP-N-acetylmuramoylalanine--D-glutamate ligase n=1 Tax=Carboxylicivirga mesophila TaxID=1166478 RepID=A0ABS5KEJ2_9BACT|nr:UDP-N-acetylmuramoyl-L-alanine--D-glutamate ligase [Carboxylicivirga mesophila]MBS2212748.1 UDP-N-acetylmuramoyl-L-alanine--D-glutamate ligase [Carboxylicivirga mesophila]